MINSLALPNDLHPRTPLTDPTPEKASNAVKETEDSSKTHLELGKNLIDFRTPQSYYLIGEAAKFEFNANNFFLSKLKDSGFSPIVPPDFAHAAIMEGTGEDLEKSIKILPEKEKMYLPGGCSLPVLCANYVKQSIPKNRLPVRHVVGGKRYMVREGVGLFGAWQRSCVDVFVMTDSMVSADQELDNMIAKVKDMYDLMGWEYRLVYQPVRKLRPWESLRASFEMYSCSSGKYVEVGNVVHSGQFVTQRLVMAVKDKNLDLFGYVVSGNVVDLTSVLACLIEQTKSLSVPTF